MIKKFEQFVNESKDSLKDEIQKTEDQLKYAKANTPHKVEIYEERLKELKKKLHESVSVNEGANPPVLNQYDPDDFMWSTIGSNKRKVEYSYDGKDYVGEISGDLVDKVLDRWVDAKSAKHSDVARMVSQLTLKK